MGHPPKPSRTATATATVPHHRIRTARLQRRRRIPLPERRRTGSTPMPRTRGRPPRTEAQRSSRRIIPAPTRRLHREASTILRKPRRPRRATARPITLQRPMAWRTRQAVRMRRHGIRRRRVPPTPPCGPILRPLRRETRRRIPRVRPPNMAAMVRPGHRPTGRPRLSPSTLPRTAARFRPQRPGPPARLPRLRRPQPARPTMPDRPRNRPALRERASTRAATSCFTAILIRARPPRRPRMAPSIREPIPTWASWAFRISPTSSTTSITIHDRASRVSMDVRRLLTCAGPSPSHCEQTRA